MLQPSNRFGWMGRGRGPAVGLMIARSVTAACPRIGGAARPAFEVVRVIIDQSAVAAKTRSLAGGTQFLQLARAAAAVMGRLRGVEIGTLRWPQADRKSVVEVKRGAVRVDLGGR